jgi:hypothetical protein
MFPILAITVVVPLAVASVASLWQRRDLAELPPPERRLTVLLSAASD